jgi:hypothetical protein
LCRDRLHAFYRLLTASPGVGWVCDVVRLISGGRSARLFFKKDDFLREADFTDRGFGA